MKAEERSVITQQYMNELKSEQHHYRQCIYLADTFEELMDLTHDTELDIKNSKRHLKIALMEEWIAGRCEEFRGGFELFGTIADWRNEDDLYKVGWFNSEFELIQVLQVENCKVTKLLSDEEFGAITNWSSKDYDYLESLVELFAKRLEEIKND